MPVVAVDALSFDVRPGVVIGFLGPNGSGKSTTMRIVLDLDRPDAWGVRVGGRRYRDLPWPLREVGAVLEAKAFQPGRSARSHLAALAARDGIARARVDQVLDLVRLTGAAGRRAGRFSLGMAQRLGIAAAFRGDPGVLLFDEPAHRPTDGDEVRDSVAVTAGRTRTAHSVDRLVTSRSRRRCTVIQAPARPVAQPTAPVLVVLVAVPSSTQLVVPLRRPYSCTGAPAMPVPMSSGRTS